jgi:hypothetical protein
MKTSKAIKKLADIMCQHGDLEVKFSLLSENGDIDFDEFTIDEWVGCKGNTDKVCITYDIEDIKEFKKQLKNIL